MKAGYKLRSLAYDDRVYRPKFAHSMTIERDFMRQLKKVARMSGGLVEAHVDGANIIDPTSLAKALAEYSKMLGPWAERKAKDMLAGVSAANYRAWLSHTKSIGKELRAQLLTTPLGGVTRGLQAEQVKLIKSIPIEAGERAQKLAMEAATNGDRSSVVAKELLRTTEVTENRAELIARTEVARSNAHINQARAQNVGANSYIWRTMEDADVREEHAEIDGQTFSYDDPPEFDDGDSYNPGEFCNCRCYAEPVIDTD